MGEYGRGERALEAWEAMEAWEALVGRLAGKPGHGVQDDFGMIRVL
jgi:hypothetical protein